MQTWLNLQDKIIIVTGGASGIGLAIVEELLAHREVKGSVKEYLLSEYGVQKMSDRIARQLLTLPVSIDKIVFKAAWVHLNSEERASLMIRYLGILEADDFEQCFSDLGRRE